MVVFDFDKTLTYQDTLAGFYKEVAVHGSKNRVPFLIKRMTLLCFAILYKLKFIDNTALKKIGVALYLKGLSNDEINKHAVNYSKKIKLNTIYEVEYLKTNPDDRIVITASFSDYVKPLFPGEKVFGSELKYVDKKVAGLSVNMYRAEKVNLLINQGIQEIDAVYTDSYSDQPLMDIATQCFLVRDNKIQKIK